MKSIHKIVQSHTNAQEREQTEVAGGRVVNAGASFTGRAYLNVDLYSFIFRQNTHVTV